MSLTSNAEDWRNVHEEIAINLGAPIIFPLYSCLI